VPRVAFGFYRQISLEKAFDKFDYAPGIDRVFDSGGLQIYDVSEVAGVR
jgi:hypothetical protein